MPIASQKSQNFEHCSAVFPACTGRISSQRSNITLDSLQTIRGFSSTSSNQQHADQYTYRNIKSTDAISKDSHSDTNSAHAHDSQPQPYTASSSPNANLSMPMNAEVANASVLLVDKEINRIQLTTRNAAVPMTSEARARTKARLLKLREMKSSLEGKAEWWQSVYEDGPPEINAASDVYKRVKVAKTALELDAKRERPVWTPQEREALSMGLKEWEERIRKDDKWYKKWGPAIIGTVILNMILP
ncbi:MAG: hypothetical protein Q9225_003425 [Loekoesia sp. 1 TL-2023]